MSRVICIISIAVLAACGFGDNRGGSNPVDGGLGGDSGGGGGEDAAIDGATPACELVPQSGCSGQACDLAAADDGSTACRAITAAGTADSRCAVDTACAAGFTCFEDTAAVSYCMQFCNTTADCGARSQCAFELESAGGDPLGAKVCSNSCTIVGQAGCPTGTGCFGIQDGTADYTDCRVMGTKAEAAPCDDTLECRPGSVCVDAGGGGRCRQYCQTADLICNNGLFCVGFTDPLVIGGVQIGACVL